jgi:hypothetical protein
MNRLADVAVLFEEADLAASLREPQGGKQPGGAAADNGHIDGRASHVNAITDMSIDG